MRAGELLGARVRTAGGRSLGTVAGLRCSLDGPSAGPVPAPRVTALVVSPGRVGGALGYQQEGQRGPWLVRVVVDLLHRHRVLVDWTDVAAVGAGEVALRPEADVAGG
jgi:hypothetical protein